MNTPLRCLLIDDEPLAQELLLDHVAQLHSLDIVGVASNALQAIELYQTLKPDLLLLDINLPRMNGYELLGSLPGKAPWVIVISGYQEFAFEGFENNVVDFLLKPVVFSRFVRAITKVQERVQALDAVGSAVGSVTAGNVPSNQLAIKDGKTMVNVACQDIILVEAMSDYVKITLPDRVLVSHQRVSALEKMLPAPLFVRVNRSFIINTTKIRQTDGQQIEMQSGQRVPVGTTYRSVVSSIIRTAL
ncbi:DNA-binding LytR/AlgR family response regulator [Spirosoma lacussanchae]|uniref:LytR/AlgR family response regulator transcription factor n=1 Tax=Spirosoma lacussanchae TaxID=1884249 RepID=UPI001108511F|nr:LytTR family DNA-binding domain-containing protein [Spirosoma lacussanchae]